MNRKKKRAVDRLQCITVIAKSKIAASLDVCYGVRNGPMSKANSVNQSRKGRVAEIVLDVPTITPMTFEKPCGVSS